MSFQQRLGGRVAYVTGGAGGQGAAHALRLAREGATVYFGDIAQDEGRHRERELRDAGFEAEFLRHDVRSGADWDAVRALLTERHGRLDILVNNAGVVDLLGFDEATEETWQRTIDINQTSVFLGLKHMRALLRASAHGSVINTSSIFGLIGVADYAAYIASKAAVAGLTKSAAMSFGPEGTRVNSIHPGYVDTPMLRAEFEALPEGSREASLASIPLGRFASAEDIASVIAFLASDDSAYITGAEIVVDGGLLAGR